MSDVDLMLVGLNLLGTMLLLASVVSILGCIVLLGMRLRHATSARPADLWRTLATSRFFRSMWFEAALFFPTLAVVILWSRRFLQGG